MGLQYVKRISCGEIISLCMRVTILKNISIIPYLTQCDQKWQRVIQNWGQIFKCHFWRIGFIDTEGDFKIPKNFLVERLTNSK